MLIKLKNGSGTIDLRFLAEDVDRHGNVRIYFRRKGHSKIRLVAEIGSDDFLAEYNAALARTAPIPRAVAPTGAPPARDTLRWIVTEYLAKAASFQALDLETQKVYRGHLERLCQSHGDKRYARLRAEHIEALRDAKADTPGAANTMLKALRSLFKWAKKLKLVSMNPMLEVETFDESSEGHHTWTVDEILQFMHHHPAHTQAGLAIAILFYLGPRRSDVVRLGRQMETRDGGIRWTEHKGRKKKPKVTERVIEPALRNVLDRHRHNHLSYLVTAYGAAFTAAGFANKFKGWCVAAGLAHCSMHGVRKGSATNAADNGATEHQLMAMFGWSNPGEAARYTRKANRKRLAAAGGKLLSLEGQNLNESVPPKQVGDS